MNEQVTEVVQSPGLNVSYYLGQIFHYLTLHYPDILIWIKSIIGYLVGISIVVSIMLFFGIIYSVERLKAIRKREEKILDAKVDIGYDDKEVKSDPESASRWEKVVTLISSQNQNDWKQAILEADIILGKLLTGMGYKGEGIGEQLKRVVKGDFESIDQAWEAHKIRNMVAHDGSTFTLNHHEAKRVINLYKQVFQEFFYI